MLKEEALYGLFHEVRGPHGEIIKAKERIGELGSKEEKETERKHLQDVSPKEGNNYNVYTVSFFGNSSYYNPENPDKVVEDINKNRIERFKDSVDKYGYDFFIYNPSGYIAYSIDITKDNDEYTASSFISTESGQGDTDPEELFSSKDFKEVIKYLYDEGYFDEEDSDITRDEAEEYLNISNNTISSDLPTEVEIEYASLNTDVLEYYDLEEAIKQYLQELYDAKVVDFSYYWYDINTLIVHDIKWSVEESLDDDTIEETNEYKIVKSIQHNFRTVKGVARKGKDKIIYQVYFRTQDFNPATNRWQKTGWSNSTAEFDTVEDAREFVKKYGKTLKSELKKVVDNSEKNLIESIKDDFWNLRNLKEPKYGTGNLVLDGNKIRPLTNDEVANKFAVSIEHADKNDLKTKKELIDFANKTDAEKIMFFFMPGDNYSGEYSFLYSDEDKVRDIWKNYKQYAYAMYDKDGEYHEITESLTEEKETQIYKKYKLVFHPGYNFWVNMRDYWRVFAPNGVLVGGMKTLEAAKKLVDKRIADNEDHIQESVNEDIEKQRIKEALKSYPEVKIKFGHLVNEDEIVKWALENIKDADEDTIREVISELLQVGFEHGSASKESDYEEGSLEEDIEKHETLNSAIFDVETQEMLPEVREKLLEIADNFVDEVHEDELDLEVKDIVLIGSNANYNYTKDSDLDVHIIASSKPDCNKKHLNQIYQAYKSMFNKNYDITIHGIPTEIYVEMDEVNARSGGIYSIKDNKWLKQPKQFEVPDIDYDAFYKEFEKWEERYFELVNYLDDYENASEEVDKYIDDIYEVRQEGIERGGETDTYNLVFKEIRNRGYLDHLKDLKTELASKEMSLESIDK